MKAIEGGSAFYVIIESQRDKESEWKLFTTDKIR